MQEVEFLKKAADGIDELRISDVDNIKAPVFTPEVSGPECLQSLLSVRPALDQQNPIMVPGHRWQDIRSKPRFKEFKKEIQEIVLNHPIYYYEPVELFRYTRPQRLVTYGFRGDRSRSRSFYSELRSQNYDEAIDLLPRFFQPFVEKQMKSLLESKELSVPQRYDGQKGGKIYEAWRDSRADSGFTRYFERIADDAARSPNSAIIPPVPPILKSSGQDAISRTVGFNSYMRMLCETKWNEPSSGTVTPYLHFYVDQGIFEPDASRNEQRVKQTIGAEISNADYAGIALTISNLPKIWEKGNERSLERFMVDVSNVAQQNHLPIILPRSGYFGMYLTDFGIQSFSTLMNGNHVYLRRGGGIDERAKYGTIPIYGSARDVNVDGLGRVLGLNGGEVHNFEGLPQSPPTFNPTANSYKSKFGDARRFRYEFGKPRRLIHVKEAKELREALRRGTANPAKRYLERSENPYLA